MVSGPDDESRAFLQKGRAQAKPGKGIGPVRSAFYLGLLFLFLCLVHPLHAEPPVIALPDIDQQALDEGLHYLVEGDTPLDIDDIRRLDHAEFWTAIDGQPNFGYRRDPIWYHLAVRAPADQDLDRYVQIAYPLLDSLSFYLFDSGGLVYEGVTGDRLPFHHRPIPSRTFVFPVQLSAGERYDLYFRVQTSGSHQLPAHLWAPEAFHAASKTDTLLRAIIYGSLLMMAAFSFLLFLTMRDRALLYSAAVKISLLLLMLGLHGVAFQYLVPGHPRLHELLILTALPLALVSVSLFCLHFLELKRNLPWGYNLSRGLVGLGLLAALGGLVLPYDLSTRLSVILAIIVCLTVLSIGFILLRQGNKSARNFVFAWLALLLGGIFYVAELSGSLPSGWQMTYAVESGAVMASLLLSFALGERFHNERMARIEEQHARIEALKAREQAEQKVLENARHHMLTGLPNRVALEEMLEKEIQAAQGSNDCIALVLLHLKGFDDINKTLGHENADAVLVKIAERMDHLVRQESQHLLIERKSVRLHAVAHVEGITFACAFRLQQPEQARPRMQSIANGVRRPLSFQSLSLEVGLVGGCAFHPQDSGDVATLLRHAFIAFDRANSDVDQMAIFTEDLNPYSARRLTLMTELRAALEGNGLSLHFQPQIRINNGEIFGFEALIRWIHPDHGFIPPDEFIPMAEQTGLIRPLTQWVLNEGLGFLAELEGSGERISLSVNISAMNLRDPGFADQVRDALKRHSIEPHRLALEITETATMTDPQQSLQALRALHDADIRLSIDDFGTGYSSLAYIRKLPVHEIKIDRSFVMEMDRNRDDATIVQTSINMCHDLGYKVVAEGVETQHTCELLSEMGCDIAQGYHIARPMPASDMLGWIRSYQADPDSQHFPTRSDKKG